MVIPFPVPPPAETAAEHASATETEGPGVLSTEPEPLEASQDAQEGSPDATYLAETPEIAPSGPEIEPEVAIEQAGEVIGALIAGLSARIAALEAVVNGTGSQVADEPPAVQNFSRERRLRIIRRYLAMRHQRELDRAALIAGREYLNKVDRRAEDAEFKAAEMSGRLEAAEARLAAETARADSADARGQILLDEKQARIVALENEKIEWLSGGRINMGAPPMRATPRPFLVANA